MKPEDIVRQAVPSEPGLQAIAEEADKRRHARIPVSVTAEVIETKTHARVAGRATDLGVGGCYIDAPSAFSEGSEVDVILHWRERTLQLRALVSYVMTGSSIGMGLAFTGTSAHQGATLLDWLTAESSGNSQEPPQVARPEYAADANASRAALEELVTLLVRKQVLSTSEGARIQDRLSRSGVQDAP